MIFPEWDLVSDILLNTVRKDTSKSFEAAIIEIYLRMRPGDPPDVVGINHADHRLASLGSP